MKEGVGNTLPTDRHVRRLEGMADSGFVDASGTPHPSLGPALSNTSVEHETDKSDGSSGDSRERLVYSKDDLMLIGKSRLSLRRPSCLDPTYFRMDGDKCTWDTVAWHANMKENASARSEHSSSPIESSESRERPERDTRNAPGNVNVNKKRPALDQKEKLKEEQDGIVLSPQRKSFVGGCHATFGTHSMSRREADLEGREVNGRGGAMRGRGMYNKTQGPTRPRAENNFYNPRDRNDYDEKGRKKEYEGPGGGGGRGRDNDRFERERNMGPGLLDSQPAHFYGSYGHQQGNHQNHQRYPRHGGQHENNASDNEPLWYTEGPSSQFEMCELRGFDGDEPESTDRDGKTAGADLDSRPPSSVDPVSEPCDGVRHSSPIPPPGLLSDANGPEGAKDMMKFDFDDFLQASAPAGEPAPGASRFLKIFNKGDDDGGGSSDAEADKRRGAESKELDVKLFPSSKPGNKEGLIDPEALFMPAAAVKQEGQKGASGQNAPCEKGGKILSMLQKAEKEAREAGNTGEDVFAQQAHIRQMILEGKVKSVDEVERGFSQTFNTAPRNDMSAFNQLLAQVNDGQVKPMASVGSGIAPQQRDGDAKGPAQFGYPRGEVGQQPSLQNSIPLFNAPSREPILASGLENRLLQGRSSQPGLKEGVHDRGAHAHGSGIGVDAMFKKSHNLPPPPQAAFPHVLMMEMTKANVNPHMILAPESQRILCGVVTGQITVADLSNCTSTALPDEVRMVHQNVLKAITHGFDPHKLIVANYQTEVDRLKQIENLKAELSRIHVAGRQQAQNMAAAANARAGASGRGGQAAQFGPVPMQNAMLNSYRQAPAGFPRPPSPGLMNMPPPPMGAPLAQGPPLLPFPIHGSQMNPFTPGHPMYQNMAPPAFGQQQQPPRAAPPSGPATSAAQANRAPGHSLSFVPTNVMKRQVSDRNRDTPTDVHQAPDQAFIRQLNSGAPGQGNMPENVARLMAMGNGPNRPMPQQVMSVTEVERMMRGQQRVKNEEPRN